MLDRSLMSILVCPADRGPLLLVCDEGLRADHGAAAVLYNPRLHRAYRIDDDIPVLLVDEAVDVSDDEHRRLVELAGQSE